MCKSHIPTQYELCQILGSTCDFVFSRCGTMAFSVCLLPSASEELRKLWDSKDVGKLSEDFYTAACQM